MNDLLLPAIQKSAQEIDPYYNLVSLHLKGDVNTGRNYNAFSDASSNNFRLTNSGDVRGSSFSPYGTSWSGFFGGGYITVPSGSAVTPTGTQSYCLEFFAYITGFSGTYDIFVEGSTNTNGFQIAYFNDGGASQGKLGVAASGVGSVNTATITGYLNKWVHVVATRSGNDHRLFFDGVLVAYASNAISFGARGTQAFGAQAAGTLPIDGYMSNIRVCLDAIPTSYQTSSTTVGTSVFSAVTSPLTTSSQGASSVALITCHSNRFIDRDNGTGTVALTLNGTLRISSFSPFLETDTTSGSGYYDGTGDGLAISTAQANLGFGTGDFSTEFWAYRTNSNSFIVVFQLNTYNTGLYVRTESTTYNDSFYFVNNSYNWDPATNFPANTWTHICITRQSSTLRFFVNGKLIINATNTANMGAATADIGPAGYAGYLSDVRVVKGSVPVEYQTSVTTVGTQVFTPPTSLRTAVTNTQLLTLQERGAYNTIGFQDESEYQHVITRPSGANVAQGTFSPFSNAGWSNLFNGSSGYISAPGDAGFAFGTDDFTIEMWVNITGTNAGLICHGPVATAGSWMLEIGGSIFYWQAAMNANLIQASASSVLGTGWKHVAVTRASGTTRLFVDGGLLGSSSAASNFNTTTGPLWIGRSYNNSYTAGHISNVRVIKNQALYTGAFTPPANQLTAKSVGTTGANVAASLTGTVSLLTCQSNRFLDQTGKTITVNGSPSVAAFSPFAPVAYDPAVHGGSGYFDGTGDYINLGNQPGLHLGSGDYTVELWMWKNTNTAYMTACGDFLNASTNTWQMIGDATGTKITWYNGASMGFTLTSVASIPIMAWTHIAFVRLGTTLTLYINGVSDSSASLSTNYNDTTSFFVGHTPNLDASRYWNGYISGFRLVKGTAVYTSNFTPPSGPLPLISNTSLLLNFTNGGVIDSTGKNVFETYGNAGVVTTSIKKYGSGSMYFDGTGDYLFASPSQNFSFGTGDFTIEAWFYTAVGTNNAIFQISNTAGGFHTNYTNTIAIGLLSGKLNLFGVAGTGITSTGASYATSSWVHVALVRSSGVTKLYLNGTLDTTVGTSGSITDTTNYTMQYIIVGGYFSTSYLWNGYIDDLRITRGLARYTANFTAPTKALPDRGTTSTLTTDMAAPSSVEALVVAGGAAGGLDRGGGGGAGGFREFVGGNAIAVSSGTNYAISIGAGGAVNGTVGDGNDGNISRFGSVYSSAGGGGGGAGRGGRSGGSGGGSAVSTIAAGLGNSGSYSPVEGYGGGLGNAPPSPGDAGGGGGGAGGAGSVGGSTGGAGGIGAQSSITGVPTYYAGGGGGGKNGGTGGAGGQGGGGAAQNSTSGSGTAGTANTGGGGGAGSGQTGTANGVPAAGGSGVVILAYPTSFRPLKASLGLVYTIDTVTRPGYRVYKFTAGTGTISW